MSDPYTGARSPGYGEVPAQPVVETYPTDTYATETYPATNYPVGTTTDQGYGSDTSSTGGAKEQAKQVAGQSAQAAGSAASDVKDTAKEQVQRVAGEAKSQVRGVASEVKDRVGTEAKAQTDRLSTGIREIAGQLDEMRGDREGSPAATVVSRVADGGRQIADYIDRNGPEGVLREVQDFARRRPGAFLATALVSGFVVGRLGKGVLKADENAGKPAADSYTSSTSTTPSTAYVEPVTTSGYVTPATDYPATGYTTGTEYAATGTGTPVVVPDEYPGGTR